MKVTDAPIITEAKIQTAIAKKGLDQQKQEGEAVLDLIDNADAGFNHPLQEGHVGRTINLKI